MNLLSLAAVALCMGSFSALTSLIGQQPLQPDFKVHLEPPNAPFPMNSRMEIMLDIENISSNVIPMGIPPGNYIGNACRVDLKDADGKPVFKWRDLHPDDPNVGVNQHRGISTTLVRLKPGEVLRRLIDLSVVFRITSSGAYSLQASCFDRGLKAMTVTAPIEFTVVPAQ